MFLFVQIKKKVMNTMKKLKLILCFVMLIGLSINGILAEEDSQPVPDTGDEVDATPTEIPEIMPTEAPEVSIEDNEVILPIDPNIIPEEVNEQLPTKEYEIDGLMWREEDSGLTLQNGIDLIKNQSSSLLRSARASAQLIRVKRLAQYDNPVAGHPDWISMFSINGTPAYCIEPFVVVILDGAGNGPNYDPVEPKDLSYEQLVRLGRIMFYGYGHPLSGSNDNYWLATQLLVWQITAPGEYGQIMATLKWCDPADQVCATTGGAVDVSTEMNVIMNLVDNFDKVPSFADEWHGTRQYNINWNETLRLTDTNGVFD